VCASIMALSANIPHATSTTGATLRGILSASPVEGTEMQSTTRDRTIWWVLRVAVGMCFIGHGMFGIITKAEWVPFFGLVGIGAAGAYALMPLIGMLDIALGISVVVRPTRAVLVYMAVWGVWTAALRPLTGDSAFELLERAGNYGAPLALLVFAGAGRGGGSWLARARPAALTAERETLLWRVLSVTTALLLVGHAGLAIAGKPLLVEHAALIGMDANATFAIGIFELVLAATVLVTGHPVVLLGVALWKIGTEMLFPLSGTPIWEFVERGGSYGAPLAMTVLALARPAASRVRAWPSVTGLRPAMLIAGLLLAAPALAQGQGGGRQQREDRTPIAPAGIFDSLRHGGYVLACRHGKTNHSQRDSGRAREQQRNLDDAGERESKAIGAAIQALRIPIGDVLANPMYRNYETGVYAFGRAERDSLLAGRASPQYLKTLLMRAVEPGTNRAIVTRVGILSGAMEDHGVRRIEEGDCFVVRPAGDDFTVMGRLRVKDWPGGDSGGTP